MNENFEKQYSELNKKTKNLHSCFMNLTNLQKKTTGELSQYINKQANLKKQLVNKIDKHETVIAKELRPFIETQENINEQIGEQVVQQERLKKQVLNHLEQYRLVVSEELQSAAHQQEEVNKQVVERLDQQENLNKQALELKEEFRMATLQELQPVIKDIENHLDPIANLLNGLSPGTLIEQITIQGSVIEVKSFVDFISSTNISTFLLKDNEILSINANRIDSLIFG